MSQFVCKGSFPNFPLWSFDQMHVFLGHSRDFMGNCIGFMGLLALWCQCVKRQGIFLASWSQVGTWPSLVHPWRLRSLYHWWWYRDFRGDDAWTWWGHVDLVLKICRFLPLIIFNDIGMYWGKRFGPIWMHFLRYNGVFFTVCCYGGSALFFTLSAALENILEIYSIATIWVSPILENGACGAGFFKA